MPLSSAEADLESPPLLARRRLTIKTSVWTFPEQRVWTCPYCCLEIKASTGAALSAKRGNHLQARHKDRDKGTDDTIRPKGLIISASESIPINERSWSCPFCPKGLPGCVSRYQKEESIKSHLKVDHPKKKVSLTDVYLARLQLFKKDKSTYPTLSASKENLKRKLWAFHDNKNDKQDLGHDLVKFSPDWKTISTPQGKKKKTPSHFKGRGVTCKKCWRFSLFSSLRKGQCSGKLEPHMSTRAAWLRLQSSPKTVQQLLDAWQVTKEVAHNTITYGGDASADVRRQVIGQQHRDMCDAAQETHDSLGHQIVKFQPHRATLLCSRKDKKGKRILSEDTRFGRAATCVKCWRTSVAKASIGARKCEGRVVARSQLRTLWKNIQCSPKTVEKLLGIWNVDFATANQRLSCLQPSFDSKKGTRIGEAANPGPDDLTIMTLNVRDGNGAWRALRSIIHRHDICCLQEIRLFPEEWKTFANAAKTMKFDCYYQPGQLSAGEQPRGGVAMLVRKGIPHRFGDNVQVNNSQALMVWFQGLAVCSMYSPPRATEDLQELFEQLHVRNGFYKCDWIGAGDFNVLPTGSSFCRQVLVAGGKTIFDGSAARFDGKKCLDWFFCSSKVELSWSRLEVEAISDHKIVVASLQRPGITQEPRGRLKPGPVWTKPPNLCTDEWQLILENIWQEQSETHATFHHLKELTDCPVVKVQEEWDAFMTYLHHVFALAYQRLCQNGDPTIAQRCKTTLLKTGKNGPKGSVAIPQLVNRHHRAQGNLQCNEAMKKINKRLARLYSFRRLLTSGNPELHENELQNLMRSLWGHRRFHRFSERWKAVSQDILDTTALRHKEEEKSKHRRLKAWKDGIKQENLSQLARWLKGKETEQKAVAVVSNGRVALSPSLRFGQDKCNKVRPLLKLPTTLWRRSLKKYVTNYNTSSGPCRQSPTSRMQSNLQVVVRDQTIGPQMKLSIFRHPQSKIFSSQPKMDAGRGVAATATASEAVQPSKGGKNQKSHHRGGGHTAHRCDEYMVENLCSCMALYPLNAIVD